MFLENLYEKIIDLQEPYNGLLTLNNLSKIDYSNIEGRVELMLSIMKLRKSIGYKYFSYNKEIISELDIKTDLATAETYNNNLVIVGGKIFRIAESLAFEINEINGGDFDCDLARDVCLGLKDVSCLIGTLNGNNEKNKIILKVGLSGKQYTIKGYNGLSKFNTEELKDIMLGKDGIVGYDKIIDFILNSDNFEFIKKRYANLRLAMLSAIKEMLNNDDKSELIKAIYDNKLIEQPDTKETTVVNN